MKTAVTSVLTAPAGTGKSYMTVFELVRKFLPDTDGVFYTNLPLGLVPETHSTPPKFDGETFIDRIASHVSSKTKRPPSEFRDRIKCLPAEIMEAWQKNSGPWDYFEDSDLTGARIVIDEAHNFLGAKDQNREKKRRWQQFCGELRHRGATIQFVTQHPGKLAPEVIAEAGIRQALVDAEQERDPFFGITLAYWYELKAKLLGVYESCFVRIDLRDIDGKKNKRDNIVRVKRLPEIFELYDSFNAPEAGGSAAGADAAKREFEKRSWPSLLWWFVRENAGSFAKPLSFVTVVVLGLVFWKPIFLGFQKHMVEKATKPKQSPTLAQPIAPHSQTQDTDQVAILDERIRELEAANETLTDAIEEAEAILRRNAALAAISPTSITFADGRNYQLDQTIQGGPYDGLKVSGIDFRNRLGVLSDGQRVFLGSERTAPGPTDGRPGQPVQARPSFSQGQGNPGQASHHFSGGPDGITPSTTDHGWYGLNGDRSGRSRGSTSNFGRPASTGGRNHSRLGSPPWNAANADAGRSILR